MGDVVVAMTPRSWGDALRVTGRHAVRYGACGAFGQVRGATRGNLVDLLAVRVTPCLELPQHLVVTQM